MASKDYHSQADVDKYGSSAPQMADDLPDLPSRSQIKREMAALQELGGRLMEEGAKTWEQLPLYEELLSALQESTRIREKTARKRHRKRLGKLLREADVEGIQSGLELRDRAHAIENRNFHRLEQWRDRILREGNVAVEALLSICPTAETQVVRQQLRQLVRQADKEQQLQRPPASARKIFRILRDLSPQEDPN